MGSPVSIEVQCYSGGRADERPLRVRLKGRWMAIRRIVRQWREPDAEVFEVDLEAGERLRLRHGSDDRWTVEHCRGGPG